jgi:hypothetical protein
MAQKRKTHAEEFKARVAVEAIKGVRTLSKEPRPSWRGFLNQEDFYSSATLRAAIPPRSSERGILADPREIAPCRSC